MLKAVNDHPKKTLRLKTPILLTSVPEARLKHVVSSFLYIGSFESIRIFITAKVTIQQEMCDNCIDMSTCIVHARKSEKGRGWKNYKMNASLREVYKIDAR